MRNVLVWSVVLAVVGAFAGLVTVRAVAEDTKKKEEKAAPTGDGKANGKSEDCYQFVAPLDAIMEGMDVVFKGILNKVKADNPSGAAFKEVKRHSLFIAEIANLATHVKDFRGKAEFMTLAETMKSTALQMAEAAQKKDVAAIKSLRDKIDQTCDSCHEKFRDN